MTYYVTVHRDEEQNALAGEMLDPCTSHMVFHTGYSLDTFSALPDSQIIWEMEPCQQAKFGYRFYRPVGIPA